jgi:phosphatidylserine/phosphatidylglycerophosphate/cardiolipin synthase-like enzyme
MSESMTDYALSRVPLPMLEQLLVLFERGRVEFPLTEADLVDAGFRGRSADVVSVLRGVDAAGAAAAVRVAIAERRGRPVSRLKLVWTGPEAHASVARSTSLVVEELFRGATATVIVGGYTFDRAEILRPLFEAIRDRGVQVWMFVDIEGGAPNPADADAFAHAAIDRWVRKVWTFGPPMPRIFYDRRTAVLNEHGHDWATMHAKCVVVDDERALITSANFTDRGQTRNVEAGVLIEDAAFAQELAGHWRELVSQGLVNDYRG